MEKILINELAAKKYQIANSIEEVEKVSSGKLAGFLADEEQVKISEGRGDQLLKSTQTALKILSQNKKGFFIMIEGSQIDWGGHANDTQYLVNEMLDFDKAIGAALISLKRMEIPWWSLLLITRPADLRLSMVI